MGDCKSAGARVLAAGTGTRRALSSSLIVTHIYESGGDEPQSKSLVGRKQEERFWRRVAKLPDDYYPMDYEKRRYHSPEEAVRLGIIDEVHHTERQGR